MRFWMGTRVPAKQGAPLIISGSILMTDWLTPPNVGQGENYCKKFDPERFRGSYRIPADPFDKLRAGFAASAEIADEKRRELARPSKNNARRVAISFDRTFFGEAPSPTRRLFFRGYCRSTFSRAHFWSGDRIDKTRRRRRGTVVALTYTRRARR